MRYILLLLILVACKTPKQEQPVKTSMVDSAVRRGIAFNPDIDSMVWRCGVIHYIGMAAYECDYQEHYYLLWPIYRVPQTFLVSDANGTHEMTWQVPVRNDYQTPF